MKGADYLPMEGRTMASGISSHSETMRLSASALVYVYVFGRLPSSLWGDGRGGGQSAECNTVTSSDHNTAQPGR